MCHKPIEIWLPRVTKGWPPSWETVWPTDKRTGLRISQNWGLIPPCDLSFDTKPVLFIALICDRDHAGPSPCPLQLWAEWQSTWKVSSPVPGTREGCSTHGLPSIPFNISSSHHMQVKTRSSHNTMNWALPAGGRRNGAVGFKKMTKLPNNGNTYNKPSPQVFYLALRPCCARVLLPPWTCGSALLTHTGKIGRPLFPTRSRFLCPLPEDGNVTRARELHNAQGFMKIRIWKRERCAESGRVGRPGAWEQLEQVCNNSVLFYSIA